TFLAGAPAGFAGLGVELDPTTAEVARLCNPSHEVVAGDFAALEVVEGSAAVAIGNVPFAKLALYDGVYNRSRRLSIHDHFIVKSLAALAPRGLGLFVTSRYTLDKAASYARSAMGRYADFLGVVRLSSAAHLATAGTSVVTDVVAFRRRELGAEAVHADGFVDPVVSFG
ncbi:helicase domain protein, partial [mine drainage metagenome]